MSGSRPARGAVPVGGVPHYQWGEPIFMFVSAVPVCGEGKEAVGCSRTSPLVTALLVITDTLLYPGGPPSDAGGCAAAASTPPPGTRPTCRRFGWPMSSFCAAS